MLQGHEHSTLTVTAGSKTLVESIQSVRSLATMVVHVRCAVGRSTTDLRPLTALTCLGSLRLDGGLDEDIAPELIGWLPLSPVTQLRLHWFSSAPSNLNSMTQLPSLTLTYSGGLCNVSNLIHLTSLVMSDVIHGPDGAVTLPKGDAVQLAEFHFASDWVPLQALINLDAATGLKSLKILRAEFEDQGVVQSIASLYLLTSLAIISLLALACTNWRNCPLLELDLTDAIVVQIPAWFEELTCLRSLILTGAKLEEFPTPVLQLSNLEVLMLDENRPTFWLPEAIQGISAWTALQKLSLKPYSLSSKVRLQQLQAALDNKSILLI